MTWKKLNRSFFGCCGLLQTRPHNQQIENLGSVAVRVTESELVNVILEILRADTVVRSVKRTLQLRPESLNGVRVSASSDVFPRTVVHDLMLETELGNIVVNSEFISGDCGSGSDVFANEFDRARGCNLVHHLRADSTAPLGNSDYRSFPQRTASTLPFGFSPDVSLVSFHNTAKHIPFARHQRPDFVSHAVSGFVSHPKLTLQLFSRDSILGFCKQENCEEPRLQAGFRFVKNSSRSRMQLRSAKRAGIAATFFNPVEAIPLPALANMVCEAGAEDVIQARSIVWKLRVKIFEVIAHLFSVFLASVLRGRRQAVLSAPQSVLRSRFLERPWPCGQGLAPLDSLETPLAGILNQLGKSKILFSLVVIACVLALKPANRGWNLAFNLSANRIVLFVNRHCVHFHIFSFFFVSGLIPFDTHTFAQTLM